MKHEVEQEIVLSRLVPIIGRDMATYCMCAVYNKPYIADNTAADWREYLESVEGAGDFSSGETDANAALLAGMPTIDRWETVWGEGYSEREYKQLDYYYNVMTSQLDHTGGLDPQQRDAAISSAKMRLNKDKLLRNYTDKDSISAAKHLDTMIRDSLKDSNMRKADILPSQAQRLDGFVDALRKQGLTVEMTEDDVFEWFYRQCKRRKYEMTTDAADWMLLSILRTMAKNDDLPEPSELDDDLSLAAFEREFAPEPNEAEIDSYDYLGFVRGGATKRGKGGGKDGR